MNFVLSQIEKECLISSILEPAQESVTVSLAKIEEAVSQFPFVYSCMLYHAPKIGSPLSHQLILLVFIDPLQNDLSETLTQQWTDASSSKFLKR